VEGVNDLIKHKDGAALHKLEKAMEVINER